MYTSFNDMPQWLLDYIQTVADVSSIDQVSLEDANGLLDLLQSIEPF
jgi:hypothetical protein